MTDIQTVNSSTERGCGTRSEGGLYICIPTGSSGLPIEVFVVDPSIPWTEGAFRGPRFVLRSNGVVDLVLWVGAEYYPTVPSFIEEGRIHGFSKRVPINKDIDYSVLTSDSRIIMVHPKAILNTDYELQEVDYDADVKPRIMRPDPGSTRDCSHELKHRRGDFPLVDTLPCTFATWDHAVTINESRHRVDMHDTPATITTPSVSFDVMRPIQAHLKPTYRAGIFLQLPFSHFEYVNSKNNLPDTVTSVLGDNITRTVVTPK